MLGFMANKT